MTEATMLALEVALVTNIRELEQATSEREQVVEQLRKLDEYVRHYEKQIRGLSRDLGIEPPRSTGEVREIIMRRRSAAEDTP